MGTPQQSIAIIWPIAELLRGDYKRSDYGKVLLPFTILRRLDCVLAPTKDAVLKAAPDALKKGDKIAERLLYMVVKEFAKVDLQPKDDDHPDGVDNHDMGAIFEELIRRFSEQSNETAGEHFTPREVINMEAG